MIKKCFTINQHRTTEEFDDYEKLIKEGMFQGIEIFYPYDKTHEERKTYTENVKRLMKNDIEVVLHLPHGYYSDLCNEDEHEAILQRFKNAIDYSKQFKVNKLTLHLGAVVRDGVKKDRDSLIEKSIENVKILSDYCYPANLMIENMPGKNEIGFSPEEIEYIIKKSNRSNVKFILDFGHAHVSGYSVKEYMDHLHKYLYHLHISDNDSTRDQHKPIGSGTIDFEDAFKKIQPYDELYCLEIIYKTKDDLILYENQLMKKVK